MQPLASRPCGTQVWSYTQQTHIAFCAKRARKGRPFACLKISPYIHCYRCSLWGNIDIIINDLSIILCRPPRDLLWSVLAEFKSTWMGALYWVLGTITYVVSYYYVMAVKSQKYILGARFCRWNENRSAFHSKETSTFRSVDLHQLNWIRLKMQNIITNLNTGIKTVKTLK